MNVVKLFAVVDRVTGIFDGPHKALNRGQFLREFERICNDPNTEVGRKPEDFYAVDLGSFDQTDGALTPLPSGPERFADATDFVVIEE